MKFSKVMIAGVVVLIILLVLLFGVKLKSNDMISANHEYNIYAVNGTLPTLMIGMDLVDNCDVPSFVFYAREGTLNDVVLSKINPQIVFSEYIGSYSSIKSDLPKEMAEYVKSILKVDPKAHFNLIVDEYRGWLEFPAFVELGLSYDDYSVKYYSDGTLSYVTQYDILDDDSYDLFLDEQDLYNEIIKTIRNDKKQYEDFDYLINDKVGVTDGILDYEYDANFILLATLRENTEYFLQYPDLITFKDERVRDVMKNANLKKINVNDAFNELSDSEKNNFFKLINFDKKSFDKKYFNSKNNKYLIITGTNPFYGNYNDSKFYAMINKIVGDYGNEYKIMYKPHPSALPNDSQTKFFKDLDIDVLPGKMPMEAITFVYNDLKLGGFPSSLYMSADSSATLFFFADGKDKLVSPLNELYDELFKTVELMN